MEQSDGLLPSPIDERDILTSEVYPPIVRFPEEVPPPFNLTVSDQGNTPKCVGHASACLRQEKAFEQRVERAFDGGWIYNRCKEIDGMPTVEGTFFRAGMKVLQSQGAMPLEGGNPENYKIGSYAQVDDMSFEGLKKAIAVYGVVLAGYRGSNPGWQQTIIRNPAPGEKVWGHAVVLIGYTKDYLIIQNSWGEKKGTKGTFLAPKNYLPFEAWVCLSDLPIIETTITGWVAANYVKDGVTTSAVKLRENYGLDGKLIKVLKKGTKVLTISNNPNQANGYDWIKITVK